MYNMIFNGIRCLDMGVLVVRRPNIPSPEEDRLAYTIPGRDGVVMSASSRLEPIEFDIDLNFMVKDSDHFGEVYRNVKRWLSGPGTLQFSDDLEWFYKVYKVTISDSERASKRLGTLTATFLCDPYVYMSAGNRFLSAEECADNRYDICCPVYHITASGAWTLGVNGNSFTGTGETFIDTAEMVAYNANNVIINTSVVGDYSGFYLIEGENSFSITGGTLEIMPRWRSK